MTEEVTEVVILEGRAMQVQSEEEASETVKASALEAKAMVLEASLLQGDIPLAMGRSLEE